MEVRSRDQSIPWMKSKRQSTRYKRVSSPGIGRCLLAHRAPSFSLSVQMGAKQTEQHEDRHLYFIGPDTWMAVKPMSQLSRGGRKGRRGAKEDKNEGGGKSVSVTPKKRKEKL